MSDNKNCVAVGIDLGTVNSCLAIYDEGEVKIINTRDGTTTPSFVYFDPKNTEIMVGKSAMTPTLHSENGIFDSKRFIGRDPGDEIIKKISNNYPFKVKTEDNKVLFGITMKKETTLKTPQDVSAEILRYFKDCVICDYDADVVKAVITVPAYFNNSQKEATMEAAKLANIEVLQLISEPTAAGIYYYHKKEKPTGMVLVFDFGGGTFDVSIIETSKDEINVKCVDGDGFLGGRNIDERIIRYIRKKIIKKDKNLSGNYTNRMLRVAEEIKMNLSTKDTYQTSIDCLYDDDSSESVVMSRQKFEKLNDNLFNKCISIIDRCLVKNGINKTDINDIILVGGSTKIPIIKQKLSNYFEGKVLNGSMNPDEVVASGAAIQAYMLHKTMHTPQDETQLKVNEVTPFSIGNSEVFNIFEKYIAANTKIPITKTVTVSTCRNDQSEAVIQLYEGEWVNSSANHYLGDLIVTGLPKGPAGSVLLKIVLNIDENRILKVTAQAPDQEIQTLTVTLTKNLDQTQSHDWDSNKDAVFEKQCKLKQCVLTLCNKYIYKNPEESDKFNEFLTKLLNTFSDLDVLKRELEGFIETFKDSNTLKFVRLFKYILYCFDQDNSMIEQFDRGLEQLKL